MIQPEAPLFKHNFRKKELTKLDLFANRFLSMFTYFGEIFISAYMIQPEAPTFLFLGPPHFCKNKWPSFDLFGVFNLVYYY